MTSFDLVGYAAAACTTLAFVPQLLKIRRERSTDDISGGMYVVYIAGLALWLAYGVLVASWPVIIANAATMCFATAVLSMKWRFTRSSAVPKGLQRSDRCPLCGQPNDCGSSAGARACWCVDAAISAKALEAIPPGLRGKACLCKACACGQARAPHQSNPSLAGERLVRVSCSTQSGGS